MTKRKKFIPTPPAILRLGPNKPHRVERGVVVRFRDSNGKLTTARGVVMGNTPSNAFTRAYGREVYVCMVDAPAGAEMIARDANKRRDKQEIDKIVTRSTMIFEKSPTLLKPIGRVKKMPALCTLAMKIEKGKL